MQVGDGRSGDAEQARHAAEKTAAPLPVRLLRHPPAAGDWNMAVDSALLEAARDDGRAVLRLYQWARPTLSLGYFQRFEERRLHSASLEADVVRRESGGGAILHHFEWTYALILPKSSPWAGRPPELYRGVHRTIVAELAACGIESRLWTPPPVPPAPPSPAPAAAEPFLCFQRRSDGDLVVGDWKIVGSAQRRRTGAILQHGSLLFDRSPAAPELPGLKQLAPAPFDVEAFMERWLERLRVGLGFEWIASELTPAEEAEARRWQAERFGATEWTRLK